jgi:hypothetical protein
MTNWPVWTSDDCVLMGHYLVDKSDSQMVSGVDAETIRPSGYPTRP